MGRPRKRARPGEEMGYGLVKASGANKSQRAEAFVAHLATGKVSQGEAYRRACLETGVRLPRGLSGLTQNATNLKRWVEDYCPGLLAGITAKIEEKAGKAISEIMGEVVADGMVATEKLCIARRTVRDGDKSQTDLLYEERPGHGIRLRSVVTMGTLAVNAANSHLRNKAIEVKNPEITFNGPVQIVMPPAPGEDTPRMLEHKGNVESTDIGVAADVRPVCGPKPEFPDEGAGGVSVLDKAKDGADRGAGDRQDKDAGHERPLRSDSAAHSVQG